jgi:4-amino-4-deoxy-L-arabinose transferase-like glycosyltransferase
MEIEFKKEYLPLILIAVLGVIFIYLAAGTQMLGEDEAVYFTAAKDFMKGDYPAFTQTGFPNVFSPFVSLVDTLPFLVLGASLPLSKVIIAIFGVLTLIVVYLTGKKFGLISSLASVAILLSIPIFAQYMLINYMEVPIAFFSALAIYMLLQLDSVKKAVAAGALLSLAFYVKGSGAFLAAIIILYSLARYFYKKDINLKMVLVMLAVTLLLVLPWVARNIMLFSYPYTEGLNFLFSQPAYQNPAWLAQAIKTLSSSVDYYGTFGYIAIVLGLFGFVYVLLGKEKKLYVSLALVAMFLLAFVLREAIMLTESREFSVIFPQVAVIGALFLQRLYERNKILIVLAGVVILLSLYIGVSTGLATGSSQRYTTNYVQALTWIKDNTPQDAKIFTAYGGSLSYFAERSNVWVIDEFPEVMTTQSSTDIYNILQKHNVSYILIWSGILAQNYVVPSSNLLGAFTYNFLTVVNNDTAHFNATYQNQEDIVFKIV